MYGCVCMGVCVRVCVCMYIMLLCCIMYLCTVIYNFMYRSIYVCIVYRYRPISILPIISKIFEKRVHKRLTEFLEKIKILHIHQFGFKGNHSTDLALTFLNFKITQAVDKKQFTMGISLDPSKAFDTVHFQILFDKLFHFGIPGTPLL